MKAVLKIVVGFLISMALHYASLSVLVRPMQKSSGRSPESYMGLVFLIMLPIYFFIGSIVSGSLLREPRKKPSFVKVLVWSPGLYYLFLTLPPILVQAQGLLPSYVYFIAITTTVTLLTSMAGTVLGGILKKRKSNQAL